jgi:hypothetical protein
MLMSHETNKTPLAPSTYSLRDAWFVASQAGAHGRVRPVSLNHPRASLPREARLCFVVFHSRASNF